RATAWIRPLGAILILAGTALAQSKPILVLRPSGPNFEETFKGIKETLGPSYSIEEMIVDKETETSELTKKWTSAKPKAVFAMDNKAIALARDARGKLSDTAVPLVALMGVRVDAAIAGMSNAASVTYEIPAVTLVVNLRAITTGKISKVGVIYRTSMQDFFQKNAKYCQGENVELVGIQVADDADPKSSLKNGLTSLTERKDIDALAVFNDNFFLNAKLLKEVWLPTLSGWKRPVLVGVESLVRPELKFGTFAILPDHYALGAQAAGLLQEIEDAGWKVEGERNDQPLSVIKVLNLKGMKACCGVQEGKTNEIDKILE
ncbi:MAG TPA: hypothetical protein PKO15_13385, partial [Fibrobacteria bacterium]|nr:hypothetical protein [Fibrobacteria bacterium]